MWYLLDRPRRHHLCAPPASSLRGGAHGGGAHGGGNALFPHPAIQHLLNPPRSRPTATANRESLASLPARQSARGVAGRHWRATPQRPADEAAAANPAGRHWPDKKTFSGARQSSPAAPRRWGWRVPPPGRGRGARSYGALPC